MPKLTLKENRYGLLRVDAVTPLTQLLQNRETDPKQSECGRDRVGTGVGGLFAQVQQSAWSSRYQVPEAVNRVCSPAGHGALHQTTQGGRNG